MSVQFHATADPCEEDCEELSAQAPINPFCTFAYVQARRQMGFQPWLLSLRQDGKLIAGCTAFIKHRFFLRPCEIHSLPSVDDNKVFWDGLLDFCRKQRVHRLQINTFASQEANIPALPGEISRKNRCEYILDLTQQDLLRRFSTNHKRNVKRAKKKGVQVECVVTRQACEEHGALMSASMQRRKSRGESVSDQIGSQSSIAYTGQGAGRIFRAILDGKVVSSVLVLSSPSGGYYQTAGTSPEGMASGASHFLVYEIAMRLQDESVVLFNLGGVEESGGGLERFKRGYDPRAVRLESAEFWLAGTLKRKLIKALRLLRSHPLRFFARLIWQTEKFVVYETDPDSIPASQPREGVAFKKLSDEDLRALADGKAGFQRQADRFQKFQFNDAYGLYCDGKLAHVSWLISAEHDRTLPLRIIKLGPGEAEITHCHTLSEFRGKGLYPFAIRTLCDIAAEKGVKRVFMMTKSFNTSSQHGIEKAGLPQTNQLVRITFSCLPRSWGITYREQ